MALLLIVVCFGVLQLGVNAHNVSTDAAGFENGVAVANMTNTVIDEASGICASRRYPGVLYTHNDSGDRNRFYAISATDASLLAIIYVADVPTTDWEDIACGPCAVGTDHCIYIADVGGNAGPPSNTIILVREPDTNPADLQGGEMNTTAVSMLNFIWTDPDCETVMVDPNAEVYLVSKVVQGSAAKLYKLPKDAWGKESRVNLTGGVIVPVPISSRRDPVAGDISPNGHEVLIKTYHGVYYWKVPDLDYMKHLTTQPVQLPYILEPQGEAVCFDYQGNNYYTLSEFKGATLYLYKRKKEKDLDPNNANIHNPMLTMIMGLLQLYFVLLN